MAEWLGRSLQSFERGFDSLSRLQDDTNKHPQTPTNTQQSIINIRLRGLFRQHLESLGIVSISVSTNRFSQNPTHKMKSS